jgi:hypothetical protein
MKERKIEGIYNYCDRWCERCTFSSRCAVYEDESDLTPEENDIANKAFWDRLGQNFIKAQEMLQKAAAQAGVDLNAVSEQEEETFRRKEEIKQLSRQHPLATLSLEYSLTGRQWLKTQPGMLDRLENLKAELNLGVESTEGAKKETNTIKDSLAVIQWYLVFIHVKLSRAMMGKLSSVEWDDEERYQRDFDGSAKIALIAIERSMQAWSSLFQILPENEDDFLKILSMLEKIRTMTLQEFPDAQGFVRPGFDDQSLL